MSSAGVGSPGVDYAWARPDPQKLSEWGYRFACRYLSHDPSKNLTLTELKALLAARIDVVANWESTADSALGGAPAGTADGEAAAAQLAALAAPAYAAVYFSVDFDAQTNQYATIAAYLHAARGKLGGHRVGVYGGKALVDYMLANGHADLGWQTLAWSGGQVSNRAALYQDRTGIKLPDGSDADHNRVLKADYGGWLLPATPGPIGGMSMSVLVKGSTATVYATDGLSKRPHTLPKVVNELAATGVYGPETGGHPTIHGVSDDTINWLRNE